MDEVEAERSRQSQPSEKIHGEAELLAGAGDDDELALQQQQHQRTSGGGLDEALGGQIPGWRVQIYQGSQVECVHVERHGGPILFRGHHETEFYVQGRRFDN